MDMMNIYLCHELNVRRLVYYKWTDALMYTLPACIYSKRYYRFKYLESNRWSFQYDRWRKENTFFIYKH
jgi:hypothetical protein